MRPNPKVGQPDLNTLDANYVIQNKGSKAFQSISTLIRDNAWLFRADADGQYTALVDVFVFQSGSKPVQNMRTASGGLPAGAGSQPVPVSASAK